MPKKLSLVRVVIMKAEDFVNMLIDLINRYGAVDVDVETAMTAGNGACYCQGRIVIKKGKKVLMIIADKKGAYTY